MINCPLIVWFSVSIANMLFIKVAQGDVTLLLKKIIRVVLSSLLW